MHLSSSAWAKSFVYSAVFLAGFLALSGKRAVAEDCQSSPMTGVEWQACDKSMLILTGSDLSKANLAGANFSSTDLRGTDLTAANLEKAKLLRASLADSSAKGAIFARVEAYRTDFSNLDAPGASFQSAELQRSNFQGAKLAGADFTKADLGRSQFDNADIGGSRFALTNLARVDFRGATFGAPVDFDHAFFFLVRVEGVDLSATTGLIQWQIDMACGDDKTILPPGLLKPKTWPCKFQQE